MTTARKIEKALATVEWLTQTIRLHCFSFDDNNDTVIDELQKFIHAQNGSSKHRETAYEARNALLALRDVTASLIGDIERDLDALTFGLTVERARHILNEYATSTD